MRIYKITNLVNNKIYIGQTTRSIEDRWNGHCTCSPERSAIAAAIQKYGSSNFKIEELIKVDSQEELNLLEKKYVEEFNSLAPNGYNLKEGGDQLGSRYTDISKQKMRNAKLGTSVPEETRQKMSESHKKRFLNDPTLNEKRSISSKAIWEDPIYQQNISEVRKEYWSHPENIEAASKRAKAQVTDEYRIKISAAVKVALSAPEVQTKMDKFYESQQRVVVASDGREFPSIQEAAAIVGCPGSSIIKNIQGRYKSAGKLTWKYKDTVKAIKPILYLVCGLSGSGKTWICNQLLNNFEYLASDSSSKKNHLTKLLELSKNGKPLLYDLSVSISTFIKKNTETFDIQPVFIIETKDVILERLKQRGTGTNISDSRLIAIDKRTIKYGVFSGTSDEVLAYLKSRIV